MNKMYEGNIRKNFFIFAFPLVLTALLSQSFSMINTFLASHLIGDAAVSATGSTAPFVQLISSLLWGYGTGFSIYVATLFGRGDLKKMLNVIKLNMLIVLLFALSVSILCIAFHRQIFSFLNIDGSIYKNSFTYFAIYISGLVFFSFNWCGIYISNAIGLTKFPLFASIISNILNILCSYTFVKIFHTGVGGIAAASVLSNICVAVFYARNFCKNFKSMGLELKVFHIDKKEIKWSVSYALPTMLQQSVMYACTALVSPLTNLCGTNAIAGYTIGMKLYDLNSGVYQNSNKTISTYVAHCVGGGKFHMIKTGIYTGLSMTLLFLAPFLLVTVFGARTIADVFLDDPEGINYAMVFMKFCMPFVLFNVINNLLHAVFRSSGAGRYLVLSTAVYAVSRILFSYVLFTKYEMAGIYAAGVLSWVIEAIFGMAIYYSGKWKSQEYRGAECVQK